MSARIHVREGEAGRVWVFAVDLAGAELEAFTRRNGSWPLREALGAEALDPARVEVFAVSDLEGVGLARYLQEGHGIAPGDLQGLRERLDAQTGTVMVLASRAFEGREQTLTPRAPLRLLASLSEERTPVTFASLPSEAAVGTVAPAPASRPARGRWGCAGVLIIVVAAILLALLAALVAR